MRRLSSFRGRGRCKTKIFGLIPGRLSSFPSCCVVGNDQPGPLARSAGPLAEKQIFVASFLSLRDRTYRQLRAAWRAPNGAEISGTTPLTIDRTSTPSFLAGLCTPHPEDAHTRFALFFAGTMRLLPPVSTPSVLARPRLASGPMTTTNRGNFFIVLR